MTIGCQLATHMQIDLSYKTERIADPCGESTRRSSSRP